eukprot:146959-Prymnesium_polylepis.1
MAGRPVGQGSSDARVERWRVCKAASECLLGLLECAPPCGPWTEAAPPASHRQSASPARRGSRPPSPPTARADSKRRYCCVSTNALVISAAVSSTSAPAVALSSSRRYNSPSAALEIRSPFLPWPSSTQKSAKSLRPANG